MFAVLRSLLVVLCALMGGVLALLMKHDPSGRLFLNTPDLLALTTGVFGGMLLACVAILCERLLRRLSLADLAVLVLGLVLGACIAYFITYFQILLPRYVEDWLQANNQMASIVKLALYVMFVYIGMVVAVRGKKEFSLFMPQLKLNRGSAMAPLLLDTSAIIDGRVADLYKSGFLRNKILLPEFVLHELQLLSDSQVAFTRMKGRRGLEILKKIQDSREINVEVTSADYPEIEEVDDKLLKLAKEIDAVILTTDFNLEQIAKIHQIQCLNIFGLANALKTPFIPGEHVLLQIVKEGNEMHQGVGFLDDGTMVVVQNAKQCIGQKVNVELISMVQNPSGRIFFGDRIAAEQPQNGAKPAAERTYRPPDRRRP